MAMDEVGRVSLGVALNSAPFTKSLNSLAGKAKATLGAVLSTAAVGAFSKKCLALGSDLAEVQNVVDVTFRTMSDSVNQWAQSAAGTYGLSETMAKQYVGTFGSMAEAFGFTEKQALDMSETLTGLAGDVASFYNISQDEAYTKLKSVFSGETETLKDLGIVMTQSALDAYALANGFGKTTSTMTEMEKVSLRYAFVQDQLANATGDFARTQDSWANQCRILSLQTQSAMAAVGQGLINLLTPAIKAINAMMGKIVQLANAFSSLTELVFGKSNGSGSATKLSNGLGDASSAAGAIDNATGDTASNLGSAAKSAKKLKRELLGFDQITKLSDADDSSTDATPTSSGIGNIGAGTVPALSSAISDATEKTDGLTKRWNELVKLFNQGFSIGFGDSVKRIDEIKNHLSGIKKSVQEIFNDSSVQKAANRLFDSIALNAGKAAGSMASIGVSLADNLVGGIDMYLSEHKDFIKQSLTNIFNIGADIAALFGDLAGAVGTIFESLGSEGAKAMTSGILGTLGNSALGMAQTFGQTFYSVLKPIFQPIIDNADKIRSVFEKVFQVVAPLFEGMAQGVADFYSDLNGLYQDVIRPVVDAVTDFVSDVLGVLLDKINELLEPLTGCSDTLHAFGEKIGYVIGALTSGVAVFAAVSAAGTILSGVIGAITTVAGILVGGLSALLTIFNPITLAIAAVIAIGVLLYKNWDTIKAKASELWNAVKEKFDAIKTAISDTIEGAKTAVKEKFDAIKTAVSDAVESAKTAVADKFNAIKSGVKEKAESIQKTVSEKFGKVKDTMTSAMETAKENVKTKLDNMKTAYKQNGGGIKGIVAAGMQGIKDCYSSGYNAINRLTGGRLGDIVSAFKSKLGSAKSVVSDIMTSIKKTFTDKINAAKDAVHSAIDRIKGFFKFKWSLPKLKLPHPYISGKFSLNPPSVPHFGLKWYRKAMDNPMLLDKATIFGASGNNLLGAGEAGPEVVGGARTLAQMIQSATKSGMAQMIQPPPLASVTPSRSAGGRQELDRMLNSLQSAERDDRIIELLLQIIKLLETLDIVRFDMEAMRKWIIKKTNANTRANGGKSELLV